jgi:hypothetical protein
VSRSRFRSGALLTALLAVLLVTRPASAGDPYLEWYTVHTPHFRVHYHGGLGQLAQRTATLAEAIRERLRVPLGTAPSEVTEILLHDVSDSANGSATALPYDTIDAFVTAPEDMSVLGDYDDWMVELVSHEQTHIFHLDNISGIPAILNSILGKTYAPNQVQPRWILEGLAVMLESRLTSGGRLRSSLFDMYLRADLLEDNFVPLDQMSHSVRRWPNGDIWYLYGSKFDAWIAENYGPDVFAAVAADYGENPIPWGINRSIRRATGRTYPELYEAWKKDLSVTYRAQADAVRERGLRVGTALTHSGRLSYNPRFVPKCARKDGREAILYFRDDGHRPAGFYRLPLESRSRAAEDDVELVARVDGTPRTASFDPECGLLFDALLPSERLYRFDDLEYLPPGATSSTGPRGTRERWTTGLRARSPDVSPDGRRAVFVTNHQGTTTLRIADVLPEGGLANVRRLVPSAAYEQAYTPRFSPDGKHVAYSAWTRGGFRDIRIVDVETGRFFAIAHDRAQDMQPSWSPDGKTVFFSSDRTGIHNVYAYDLETHDVRQITNVLFGAFMPEVSPDGRTLVYAGYGSRGFDLFAMPLTPGDSLPAEPARDDRPEPPAEPPPRRWPVTTYDPWPTLRPHAFTLDFASTGTFGPALTVRVSGSDVVGLHSLSGSATFNFGNDRVTGSIDYGYSRLPFGMGMSLFRSLVPRAPVDVGGSKIAVTDSVLGVTTGAAFSLPGAFDGQTTSLSYTASSHSTDYPIAATLDPYRPLDPRPFEGFLGSVHAGWSYSNAYGSLYGVSNEGGFSLSASADFAGPATGSDATLTAFTGRAVGYLRAPWARHHVFALAVSGGTAGGTFPSSGYFFTGGFSDVNVVDAVQSGLRQSGFVLRGYPPGAFYGRQFNLGNLEYRFPIVFVDRGVSTLPAFLRTLSGLFFADYGGAYDHLDRNDFLDRYHLGVGAELWVSFTLGYFLDSTVRFGWAKGFGDHAVAGSEPYAVVAGSF